MKPVEREEARKLRAQGQSIKRIAKHLKVSPSSVSLWVRDVQLTEAQRQALDLLGSSYRVAREQMVARRREVRVEYQERGRQKAREGNVLHLAGCMLYWAEGSKNRNSVKFTNSCEDMVAFFLRFLRECYGVPNDRIRVAINCFTDSGLTSEEIEQHWLDRLALPRSCLLKATVNTYSKYSSKQRRGKLRYGVCCLTVNSTELVQSVFGAIQEYGDFANANWLG